MARNPRKPQNGQNVHGFQVGTSICHIVPVSRAYRGGGGGGVPCRGVPVRRPRDGTPPTCHKKTTRPDPSFPRTSRTWLTFAFPEFFENPSGHRRPCRKTWTSAPKSVCFPAALPMGRNFLTSGHPGVRVRNVRTKSGPKQFCLCCLAFPDLEGLKRCRTKIQCAPNADRTMTDSNPPFSTL